MAIASPVSERLTVTALLLLTVATGLVDAISVLVLGHVFVANMTGNVIFLGFWFVPHSGSISPRRSSRFPHSWWGPSSVDAWPGTSTGRSEPG